MRQNFSSYVSEDPIMEIKKRIDDIKYGRDKDEYVSPKKKKAIGLYKIKNLEELIRGEATNEVPPNEMKLYLPPVRS